MTPPILAPATDAVADKSGLLSVSKNISKINVGIYVIENEGIKHGIKMYFLNGLMRTKKPYKYFINTENRNYISNKQQLLKIDNGSVIFYQIKILKETKSFYEHLYNKIEIINERSIVKVSRS